MVIDKLENAPVYYGLGERVTQALKFLQSTDLKALTEGTHEINGTDVFAKVIHYQTKPKQQGIWEVHHQYIDVQYVIEGEELFGWAPLSTMQRGEYDEATDFEPIWGDGDFVRFPAGVFVIARPQDAHMATISESEPRPVKKVVVKVRA